MTGSAGSIIASLFQGFGTNCFIFVLTLVIALPLGLIVCFGSMSKFLPLRWLTKTFVWIIRGTPLMLQLFVVMYAPGILFDTPMQSRMGAVMIAFVVNYAAYFSEIYRGGIESISKGQYEAGQVLGMTKVQIFFNCGRGCARRRGSRARERRRGSLRPPYGRSRRDLQAAPA